MSIVNNSWSPPCHHIDIIILSWVSSSWSVPQQKSQREQSVKESAAFWKNVRLALCHNKNIWVFEPEHWTERKNDAGCIINNFFQRFLEKHENQSVTSEQTWHPPVKAQSATLFASKHHWFFRVVQTDQKSWQIDVDCGGGVLSLCAQRSSVPRRRSWSKPRPAQSH